MSKSRVLVVDDEQGMLEVCADTLASLKDVEVVVEQDGERAVKLITGDQKWDLLITDVRMPGIHGVDLLRVARRHDENISVLVMTAFPSVETAVGSMKRGASDYLVKPFLPEELRAIVRRLLEQRKLELQAQQPTREIERRQRLGDMVGSSDAMRHVYDIVQRVAPNDVDVLVTGETGTGKELVARSIHQQSERRSKRFVPVDCGAIPEQLLESELFGHERGAFTSADNRSLGLMEFAQGGTFFLDEIGHLPLTLQAKLLRALQERKIRRVGGTQEIDLDVRVIAATSLNLEQEIAKGRFRADLYYRINVAQIVLPPLRERAEDITLLTRHFLQQHVGEMGHKQISIDPQVFEVLGGYRWPGNVRELQNAVRRALAMARDHQLRVTDLPDLILASSSVRAEGEGQGLFSLRDQQINVFERQYLVRLMQRYQGDVVAATEEAKVPRGTFYRLLKKHELNPADYRNGEEVCNEVTIEN